MLYEEIRNLSLEEVDEFIQLVKTDCKNYLKNKKPGVYLIRGSDTQTAIMKDIPIKNRYRSASSIELTTKLDELMKKDGLKATRLNSLFCFIKPYSSILGMNQFGYIYLIFPIDDYSITYHNPTQMANLFKSNRVQGSERITFDSPHYLKDIGGSRISSLASYLRKGTDEPGPEESAELFWKTFKSAYYQTNQISEHIDSEVMLKCERYHAIRFKSTVINPNISELFKKL